MKLSFRRKPTYRLYRETKNKAGNLLVAVMFAASMVSGSLPLFISGSAAAASNVVTPSDLGGWAASSASGGQVDFVADSTAPVGSGALKLTTDSTASSVARLTHAFDMPLSDVSTLSFQTKQLLAADTTNGNITMRINVDTDNDGTLDDQLMFEPYYNGFNGTTQTGWQTWNVATGKLWSNYELNYNGLGGVGAGSYASNFTIADVLHDFPSAKLTGLVVSMGTWNVSQQVLADNLVLNDDVFNFEPVQITPCTTTNSVVTTDLSTWDLSETRATGHNQIVPGGLHIWTESNTSTDKAAGYYTTNFPLADLGTNNIADTLTYTTNSGTIAPSTQLVVDFNNDGTPDGILVGETIYGNNWWLSNSSAQFVKDNAPHTGGGNGSNWFGTANEWLASFPSATVKSIGYSLGSGVQGDYTITKISAGCTDYTFDVAPPAAPTNLRFEGPAIACGGSTNINWTTAAWDAVSGAVSYDYHVDGPGGLVYDTNLTGTSNSGTFGSGVEGTYTFKVRSVDSFGTRSAWSSPCGITYDATAPAIPTNLSWKTSTNDVIPDGGVTKVYDGTASWQGTGDVDHYVYKYWNDITGNPYKVGSEYTANVSGTSLPGVFNQGEGVHHFCVVAVDAAGNQSACSAPFTITYDTTAPSVPVITAPTAGQHFNATPILNKWDASTDNLSGVDYYQVAYLYDDGHTFGGSTCAGVQIGGQDLSGCRDTTSTSRNHVPALSEQGGVTIWVRAYDKAGNVSDWSTPVHYFYDATAPSVPAALLFDNNDNSVADNGYITTQNFHFNLTSSPDVTRYQLKYWNNISGSPFNGEANAWSPTDLTAAGHMGVLGTYTDLFTQGEGTHYFAFSACDAAGNCSAFSAPFTVTYDATAPTTPVATPGAGKYKMPKSITLSSTDNSGNTPKIYYTLDGSTPSSSNGTLYTGPVTINGNKTLKAIAYDDAGNASDVLTAVYKKKKTTVTSSTSSHSSTTTHNTNTISVTNQNNQNANTGNANVGGNTNAGNASTGDAANDNQGVLGAATENDVKGASTADPYTVNFANVDQRSGRTLGLGWWWLLVVIIPLGFWWFIAARRRKRDNQEA